jgi:hypothetical protein
LHAAELTRCDTVEREKRRRGEEEKRRRGEEEKRKRGKEEKRGGSAPRQIPRLLSLRGTPNAVRGPKQSRC